MILCDTGFVVGTLIRSDKQHSRCADVLKTLRSQLITTWPCLTESMYLVESMGGNNAVQELCRQIESGFISLTKPAQETALRACELMRQYADTPMDFADASLVVAAEELGISTILTFDRHFYAYRIDGTTTFDVLP